MRKLLPCGILVALLLLCNTDVKASQNKTKAAPIQFDITASRLTPNFKGDNARIRAICESLPKDQPKKSDFETEAEFEKRKTANFSQLKTYVFSNVEESARKVYKTNHEASENDSWIRYDIDESVFVIKLATILVSDERKIHKGRYIGQNAFGAKTTVNVQDRWRYDAWISVDLDFELPVPVKTAKDIKNDLRVLAIVRPVAVRYEERFQAATITDPSDVLWHKHALVTDEPGETSGVLGHLSAVDVWVYNYKTGEVLYKRSQQAIEDEWRPVLSIIKLNLKMGMTKEAEEKLDRIPKATNAWKYAGERLRNRLLQEKNTLSKPLDQPQQEE